MTALLRPEEILQLSPPEADELLDRLEAGVPQHPGLVELPLGSPGTGVVFGDTHGDWRSTAGPVERFLEAPLERRLIGLGDYVDRSPPDCGEGSVANALWLLGLAAEYPQRVLLIQGNHETVRRVPALPHDLPEEVDQLWGPDADRYERILGLLERGPLAALTGSGVYLAHGGFPRGPPDDWRARFDRPTDDTIIDVTWSDIGASRIQRGLGAPITELELERFLKLADCRVFLRGHDPDVTGRPVFHDRSLTLHTTRYYERYGGVVFALMPLDRPVRSTQDLTVEHAASQGQRYPAP
jgi:hypothetical protein